MENSPTKQPLLSIQGVSKKFCRSLKSSYAYGLRDIGSELLGASRKSDRLRAKEFWALQNVSFDVYRGESLGLIGANGSGKTTLLKIIGGLIKPDTGKLIIRGKVAALIALGAGFNPLLTGRENVYINMSIFGLTKQEIDQQFESVLNFAEIWDAIDSPVRTYSSGMRARLGFACAIHTSPEILLIDEVLAVGDFAFRTKCYRKLAELRTQGVIFILVSHSSTAILSNCDSAAYLKKGELIAFGKAAPVAQQYEGDLLGQNASVDRSQSSSASLVTKGVMQSPLRIKAAEFLSDRNQKIETLEAGKPVKVKIYFEVSGPIEDFSISVMFRSLSTANDTKLFLKSARDIGFISTLQPEETSATLDLPYCGLVPGSYSMKVNLTANGDTFKTVDIIESIKFKVTGTEIASQCSYYQPRKWQFANDSYNQPAEASGLEDRSIEQAP